MSKYFNKLKQEKEVKMKLEVKKELQEIISLELKIEPGTYYHFANNMHLYNDKI